jgi:hypothetical protein
VRIAANLGVLDEVELIGRCIEHLRRIGVELIVVTDLGSIDGTREILSAYARESDVVLIQLERDQDPWGFPNRMYQMTIADFDVDLVLFIDPDEFWLPASGSLQATSGLDLIDCLQVDRFNVPVVEGRPVLPADLSPAHYDEIFLYTKPILDPRSSLERDPDLAWIRVWMPPKVFANPRAVHAVSMGAHRPLAGNGRNPRVEVPSDIVIAHVPLSTPERFTRKLANIERSMTQFGQRLKPDQAWHWRRWSALLSEGRAEQEFERQVLSGAAFDVAVSEGQIESASDWLSRISVQGPSDEAEPRV